MRFCWSLLIGLLLLVFAWYSSIHDDGHWLISISILVLLGDLLQIPKVTK